MKYSMLYRSEAPAGIIGERTLYHLSLDLSLEKIIHGKDRLSYFLGILSEPQRDRDTILYRQSILRDFISGPALLKKFREILDELDDTRAKWNDFRRQRLGSMGSNALNTSTLLALRQCSASAVTLLSSLRFINAICELADEYAPASDFFKRIMDDAKAMSTNESFSALVNICGDLAYFSESSPLDVRVTLDKLGQICAADLIGHGYIFITDPDLKQKRTWLRKKTNDTTYPCERVFLSTKEIEKLFPSPFFELAGVMDSITKQILERYGELSRELCFYEAAVEYCEFLASRGVSHAFPEFSESCVIIRDLYDLQLLAKQENTSEITPHSIVSDSPSERVVIYGGNGCGKTTLLRSLSTAQLLAQAGLPVPARSARLRVYSAVLTQFAEAEKEFEAGNEAGRFEQEVRELARVIDAVPDGAIVILNETFQTTSYEEGSAGLAGILRYLSDCGISYMLATHMMQLRPIMREEAVFLNVNERHEIVEAR